MRKLILCGVATAVLLAAVPALAQGLQSTRVIDYLEEGVRLGNGWDARAAGKTSSICVVFQEAQSQEGQQVMFERAQVSDRYSLGKTLDVSAEWQVKSWLGKSADGKAKYSSKTAIDESSLVVTELATVDNGYVYAAPAAVNSQQFSSAVHGQPLVTRNPAEVQKAMGIDPRAVHAQTGQKLHAMLANAKTAKQKHQTLAAGLTGLYKESAGSTASVRLSEDMAALAKSDPVQFRKACGDGFIAAISQGGELASTYTFHTRSRMQQDTIAAKLGFKSSGIIVDYNVSGSISSSIRSNNLQQNLTLTYFQQGGSGDPIPTTLEQIDANVTNFPRSIAAKPFNYKMVIADYATLPNYSAGQMADMTNVDKIAWEYAKAEQTYQTATVLIEDFNALATGTWQDNAYLYSRWGYGLNDLQTVQTAALNRLNSIKSTAQACLSGASSCPQPDVWDDLTKRAVFPLPIDSLDLAARDQGELLLTLFDNPAVYYAPQLINYWIKQTNAQRCRMSTDPLFCKPDAAFNDLPARIGAGRGKVSILAGYNCIGNSGTRLDYQICPNRPADKTGYVHYTADGRIQGDNDRSLCLGEHSDHSVSFQSCSDNNLWTKWSIDRFGGDLYLRNLTSGQCLSEYVTVNCGGTKKRDPYKFKIKHSLPE